jgi:cytochrome c biogenesis protein CcdA
MIIETLFGASIIVSFIAGMLALFAPCCVTFLLPVYLANIVRSKTKVFLSTFIFTLGIATVILPLALGFKIILELFFENHSLVYYLGSILMVIFGILILFRVKFGHFNFKNSITNYQNNNKIEFSSLYFLGIISGLSTACCAPVLAGAIFLAGLSPVLIQTVLVALSYTAGIVFPLFIGALFFESQPLNPLKKFLGKNVLGYSLGDLIAAVLMIGIGIWIFILNYSNQIGMGEVSEFLNQSIGKLNLILGGFFSKYKFLDFILGILILFFVFYLIVKQIKKELKTNDNN